MNKIFSNLLCCFTLNNTNDANVTNIQNEKSIDDLSSESSESLDKTNHKKFNLDNLKGKYYVKSVYDGDTVTILIPMCISQYEFKQEDKLPIEKTNIDLKSDTNPNKKIYYWEVRVRIYGIDTPEMKPSKNLPNREAHIKKAHEAKDFLSSIVLNKVIYCEFMQNDKYGRPLVKIFHNNKNISEIMIEKGHAKPYDGGTKDTNF